MKSSIFKFCRKKSLPPFRWSRPGYPINFDQSLINMYFIEKRIYHIRIYREDGSVCANWEQITYDCAELWTMRERTYREKPRPFTITKIGPFVYAQTTATYRLEVSRDMRLTPTNHYRVWISLQNMVFLV